MRSNYVLKVLECILNVVDVGRRMLVVLPEQAGRMDDLDKGLDYHSLQLLTVLAVVKT